MVKIDKLTISHIFYSVRSKKNMRFFCLVLRYSVAVFTSNIAKAGTTANASITLYGKNGDTARRPLTDSKTNDQPFKKGQVDVFIVEAVHLGDLLKVDLEHNGSDPG